LAVHPHPELAGVGERHRRELHLQVLVSARVFDKIRRSYTITL
jgi:hypothetical protein